jgi:hypothetical protein
MIASARKIPVQRENNGKNAISGALPRPPARCFFDISEVGSRTAERENSSSRTGTAMCGKGNIGKSSGSLAAVADKAIIIIAIVVLTRKQNFAKWFRVVKGRLG